MLSVDHSKAANIPRTVLSATNRKIARSVDRYIDALSPESVTLEPSQYLAIQAAANAVGIDITATQYRGAWLKSREDIS
jgi:hypothetical protein